MSSLESAVYAALYVHYRIEKFSVEESKTLANLELTDFRKEHPKLPSTPGFVRGFNNGIKQEKANCIADILAELESSSPSHTLEKLLCDRIIKRINSRQDNE